LQEVIDPLPLILMTGFGYDPGHSIVKARQAGLQSVLYKPFRLDQLLQNVETAIRHPCVRQQPADSPHPAVTAPT
jgi:FixJ family two-component response regulator